MKQPLVQDALNMQASQTPHQDKTSEYCTLTIYHLSLRLNYFLTKGLSYGLFSKMGMGLGQDVIVGEIFLHAQ